MAVVFPSTRRWLRKPLGRYLMKQETKIRNALISLYWEAHTDGRLCETMGEGILVHINSVEWANRRAKVINQTLQKLNLPNKACTRRAKVGAQKVSSNKKGSVKPARG